MLAPQIGIVFHTPCTWNYYTIHLFSSRDDYIRASSRIYNCIKPGIRSIDNTCSNYVFYTTQFDFTTAQIVINCTLKYALHYITFSLTCGLGTVYLINLKNLICVDIVYCQVKFCLLPDLLHRFLTNLASTGGTHEITVGPRVG